MKPTNAATRDRAWARYYARHGVVPAVESVALGACPAEPLTPKEREALWRAKYARVPIELATAPVTPKLPRVMADTPRAAQRRRLLPALILLRT